MSFAGKVVIVTGASSGIGAATARHLGGLGARLALADRSAAQLKTVADNIKKSKHPAPLAIVSDVNKDAARIIDETVKRFGRLDVLINCAAILMPPSSVENFDLSQFEPTLTTNVRSVIEMTKLAVPHLEKTKGNILNISSIAGMRPEPGYSLYCVSKAAVDKFTKCAALELGPKGIRVNSVNPGLIRTPLFLQSHNITGAEMEAYYDKKKKIYPLGRVGEVGDVCEAIAYLASDQAGFLTGVTLKIDGGTTLT